MKKHGNLCFGLLAGAILLAGALGAWGAARAVTAPRTGAVISAGTAPVPNVLGQTADEVLFSPWPLYETEPLVPILDAISDSNPELDPEKAVDLVIQGTVLAHVPRLASGLLGLESLKEDDFWRAAQVPDGTGDAHIFLRRFPCRMEGGEEVVLDYAQSAQSISFVVSPKQPEEAGREAQAAALAKVREDLRRFLSGAEEDGGIREALLPLAECAEDLFSTGVPSQCLDLLWGLALGILPEPENNEALESDRKAAIGVTLQNETAVGAPPRAEADLDALLQQLEDFGWSVQLLAAPHQVVTLISSQYAVVGIYYDVQLERYSGFGISGASS